MIRAENRPSSPAEWRRAGDLVAGVVARAFMVPTVELRAPSRSRQPVAYARQAALYLLHVVFGGTYQEAGSALGRERTTVAYACSLIEDDRDEAKFDHKMSHLEEWIERLWSVEQLRMLRRVKLKQEARAAA
ncbi:chromosomal replication initiator DnaA [Parvularcula sp. ZS-1/3]|uniref:Chromosomal replication initiator DnaA n=1 Tax=Parvularcula mediterranea TaxID=2732508 RepID=A0A7Y3RMW8_9PROT|nr:chromosomal replication initiator DnaA [Parvularcula mediterranea]